MTPRFLVWVCLVVGLESAPAQPFQPQPERPKIQSAAITEASGLAISPANPELVWIINDSGSPPELHLTGVDGTDRGRVILKNVKNTDWEDLASFSLDGKSYLLVADTGDNASKRESCQLHILREPALPAAGRSLNVTVSPAWQIQFRYEGGPRDCESVAADAKAGKIILVSKRTDPPEVYELPLRPGGKPIIHTARRIGRTSAKSPMESLIPFRNQPTGLDITADGSLAAIVTYYGVFLFPRQPRETWAEAFAKPPVALPSPSRPTSSAKPSPWHSPKMARPSARFPKASTRRS